MLKLLAMGFMRIRRRSCAALAASLALIFTSPAHAITYSVDDGTVEGSIGSFSSPPILTFGNEFSVVPGGETITSVSIVWAQVANGAPMTAKLWSDPNGDGNPSDSVLLSSALGFTSNAGTNIFVVYDIPDITLVVGQSFFVGATIAHEGGQAPAAADSNPPISNQSWARSGAVWSPGTPLNVGTNLGFDLMVRATGTTATTVPEPVTLALVGIALAGLGFSRRKRAS